jgi:hypothetical protein
MAAKLRLIPGLITPPISFLLVAGFEGIEQHAFVLERSPQVRLN